jgi:hypothetical protein
MVDGDNEISGIYSFMFRCNVGLLPMMYLGMPGTFRKLIRNNYTCASIHNLCRIRRAYVPRTTT